eukprot:75579-Rhodomonas_salina.1
MGRMRICLLPQSLAACYHEDTHSRIAFRLIPGHRMQIAFVITLLPGPVTWDAMLQQGVAEPRLLHAYLPPAAMDFLSEDRRVPSGESAAWDERAGAMLCTGIALLAKGLGYGVSGLGSKVSGLGFRVSARYATDLAYAPTCTELGYATRAYLESIWALRRGSLLWPVASLSTSHPSSPPAPLPETLCARSGFPSLPLFPLPPPPACPLSAAPRFL